MEHLLQKSKCSIFQNSAANLRKITRSNSNLDVVSINAYTKFDKILSIWFKNIERKQNSDINQGP